MYIHMHIYVIIHIYVYIYIERERLSIFYGWYKVSLGSLDGRLRVLRASLLWCRIPAAQGELIKDPYP